jgi:hypothetical protein
MSGTLHSLYMLIRNDEEFYWRTANIFPAALGNWLLAECLVAALDALLLMLLIAQLPGSAMDTSRTDQRLRIQN